MLGSATPCDLSNGHRQGSPGNDVLVYEEPDVSVASKAPMLVTEVVANTQMPFELGNYASVVNTQTDGVSSVEG
eukprot:133972-Alexandrium_andersonii.AAC.1